MVYKPRWIDRLIPATCLLCGARAPGPLDVCAGCLADLPWLGPACPRCAMPAAVQSPVPCGRCLAGPPPFRRCLAPFRYDWPVRELVLRFKSGGDLACGRLLAELAARHLAATAAGECEGRVLVPVPLTRRRLGERGFNQAERIARTLGRALGLPVHASLAMRRGPASTQKGLDAAARRANLAHAFEAGDCTGRAVAVVDDVVTTGATAGALAGALLSAGATDVQVWCLARAV